MATKKINWMYLVKVHYHNGTVNNLWVTKDREKALKQIETLTKGKIDSVNCYTFEQVLVD